MQPFTKNRPPNVEHALASWFHNFNNPHFLFRSGLLTHLSMCPPLVKDCCPGTAVSIRVYQIRIRKSTLQLAQKNNSIILAQSQGEPQNFQ